MSTADPTAREILAMGYGIPTLRSNGGSYYRMEDETRSIVRLSMRIHTILPKPKSGEFRVNSSMDMAVFTPERFRHPELFRKAAADPPSSVVDEDVGHTAISDEPNVYALDGTLINIRPVIEQIKKTSLYAVTGEPLYIVNAVPAFKVLKAKPAAA